MNVLVVVLINRRRIIKEKNNNTVIHVSEPIQMNNETNMAECAKAQSKFIKKKWELGICAHVIKCAWM